LNVLLSWDDEQMSIIEKIRKSYNAKREERQLSALSLAYIGDTVYDLFIRSYLVESCDANVNKLHGQCAKIVCAKGQAEAFFNIEHLLSEEELLIYKRGRNAHSGNVPKNAKLSDYRVATGFECLIGQLYLSGNDSRLCELIAETLKKDEPNADSSLPKPSES
jgi:ribonuclease-3 family protein